MPHSFYAMDTAFYSSLGVYSLQDRCEITKAVGYDATYLSVWDGRYWAEAASLANLSQKYRLDVAGVYVVLDLALGASDLRNRGILKMLETMPEGSTLELAIKSSGASSMRSDPRGDATVIKWLLHALSIGSQRGIQILLYSHLFFWMERHSDAIRLSEAINHPNLGIVFCTYHWYAEGNEPLDGTIARAMPFLRHANFDGSRRSPLGWGGVATIEALDCGELDNFAVISTLKRHGYTGPLGYHGWDEGGDPFNKLERSLLALKNMAIRAEAHPHWARHISE